MSISPLSTISVADIQPRPRQQFMHCKRFKKSLITQISVQLQG